MNILHTTHSAPGYIPPPPLAPGQVIAGPAYPDRFEGERAVSLATAKGSYDIAEVVARLPASQYPDLVVVRADSSRESWPRNIGALRCPAVVVVGDTHHLFQPIQGLLDYVRSEPFAATIFDYTRQHAHFFIEAGVTNVHWLPGFNVRRIATPPAAVDIPLSFVGTVGRHHPRRTALCHGFVNAGLPFQALRGTNEEARRIHARSQVNFNCALNGDLNLRVFEVIQSGGLLLTDRLAPEAGLEFLMTDGEHLVLYGNLAECVDRARALLADAPRARRIAAAGKAHYEDTLSPERIATDFFALVERGVARPELDLTRDRRLRLASTDSAAVRQRIAAYEVLQQIHAAKESTRVLIRPGVDPRLAADLVDLPRLSIALDLTAAPERAPVITSLLAQADAADRVILVTRVEDRRPDTLDIIVATPDEWEASSRQGELLHARNAMVLLTATPSDSTVHWLSAAGYRQVSRHVQLYGPVSAFPQTASDSPLATTSDMSRR